VAIPRKWLGLLVPVALVLILVSSLAGSRLIRGRVEARLEDQFALKAAVLARVLERPLTTPGIDLDERVDGLSELLRLPVSVSGPDGEIVADSEADGVALHRLPGLASEKDFRDAVRRGEGRAEGLATALGEEVVYLSARIDSGTETLGVVRLTVPRSHLREMSGVYGGVLAWVLALFLLIVAIGAYLVLLRVDRRLERLRVEVASLAPEGAVGGIEDPMNAMRATVRRVRGHFLDRVDALVEEKSFLSSALASMREGVMAVDSRGRVQLWNEAVKELFGDTPVEDVRDRPLLEVTRIEAVRDAYSEVLQGGDEVRRKIRVERNGGRVLDLHVVPLMDGFGVRAGALGVFFDVTQLEVLEGIRRTFVANVSHELRTPLTSVQAAAETLAEGALEDPENAREFLDTVLRSTGRMRALVDDLTDLSLIESGAIRLHAEDLELAGVVSEAGESVSAQAAKRGVRILVEVPSGFYVRADRGRLMQIVLNLLDNAVKFGPEGGTVRVRAITGDGERRLLVEDEGQGIPPQDLGKVFHRFHRVDRGRSPGMGGTGLGLSIVKHLVRLHGGSVHAENREGGGARFVVVLPATEDSPLDIA
jgi:two-component system phosphate regulon sensor histidine kinase PhoR